MAVFHTKKLINSKSGLKIVSINEELGSPFFMQEPKWVSDCEVLNCSSCGRKFNFTTRKHHCRRCGNIFCNYCCKSRVELHRMCFIDPVRVCHKCEPQTRFENMFFDKQLKLLLIGAFLWTYGNNSNGLDHRLVHCKLSSNHRFLLFDSCNDVSIAPINITLITSLEVKDNPSAGSKSLVINYLLQDEPTSLQLDIGGSSEAEKTGSDWLSAINEAYKLLHQVE